MEVSTVGEYERRQTAAGFTCAVKAVVAEVAPRLVGVDAAGLAACDGVLHDIDGARIGCPPARPLQPNTRPGDLDPTRAWQFMMTNEKPGAASSTAAGSSDSRTSKS